MTRDDPPPKTSSGLLGRLFGSVTQNTPKAETPLPAPAATPSTKAKTSWWMRLRHGLSRSSQALSQGISDVLTKRKLDRAVLDDLEDILIRADLGIASASHITAQLHAQRHDTNITASEVKALIAHEIELILAPVAQPLMIDETQKPFVILVVGVNGAGKTTTIGKLAALLRSQGKKVMLAAGDTFRAAAIEQLQIWGARLGAEVIARPHGADAAGLAFDAMREAQDKGADILLMDTAGRLHNRTELMAELEKIVRVIKKNNPHAPHAVLLVLDAAVGQNALNQVEIFGKTAGVTGLVMTKLDGTARGGILVAIAQKYKLPIHFIGVGESMDDLEPFTAHQFAHAIMGADSEDESLNR